MIPTVQTPLTAIPAFNDALATFVAHAQANINAHFKEHYTILDPPTLVCERGSKYVRIVKAETSSRSVFCFVRIVDGAILKAASWKAPAKHSRGSIYVNAGQDAVTTYGANYLR